MASLSSSCTLFTTTKTTSSSPAAASTKSSSRPLFAKPSHFFTHAKTIPRLRFSCNARNNGDKHDSPNEGKVDRRNMLFGLGGLYGAANLASNPLVMAEPIKPPELDKCGTATNWNNGQKLESINCCPPMSKNIIDYQLPPVQVMRVRPSAHRVTPEYIFKYNTAIDRMKRLPANDPRSFMQQANIHCAYCNGAYDQPGHGTLDIQVHYSWLFFPFHRWYLYFYERILGKLIGDPTFVLPFWNWDNPRGMTMPPMFLDPKSALYDEKRNPESTKTSAVVDLGLTGSTDTLQVVSNNLSIMHSEMIRSNSSAEDFMGAAYRAGDDNTTKGQGSSERGSHTSIHGWVGDPRQPSGEDLGNFYSAGRDPLFYCHHANVDRMWTLWQYFLPSEKLPDKRITDSDFLNAAFLFYDENAQLVRVTVKDCLDNMRMGYEYERIDLPWLDYRPPAQTATAKVVQASKSDVPQADSTVFPIVVDKIIRVIVPKTKKGQADELLVLEDIEVDPTKLLKVDVFVNDEDDNLNDFNKAAYAGTYAQVPHKSTRGTTTKSSIRLKLTELYKEMDVADDDTVLVTLVPRHRGGGITIGGIKIIEDPAAKSS